MVTFLHLPQGFCCWAPAGAGCEATVVGRGWRVVNLGSDLVRPRQGGSGRSGLRLRVDAACLYLREEAASLPRRQPVAVGVGDRLAAVAHALGLPGIGVETAHGEAKQALFDRIEREFQDSFTTLSKDLGWSPRTARAASCASGSGDPATTRPAASQRALSCRAASSEPAPNDMKTSGAANLVVGS